jgi:membrane-bound lytic murein transglycosylase F
MPSCASVSPYAPLALMLLSLGAGEPEDLTNLEVALTRHTRDIYAVDLDEIKKRGVLRVLTRNNSAHYYIARGEQRGFEYELAKAFAKELGVRLAVVVPPSRNALIKGLLDGHGDMIAAGTTITNVRGEKVLFTPPVTSAPRVVTTHENIVKPLETLEDLSAFEIHLSFRSTTLRDMRAVETKLGRALRLVDVTDGVEMEAMVHRVGEGEYEATVIDEDLLHLAQAAGEPVQTGVIISEARHKGWAVHPGAPALHEAASQFIEKHSKSGLIRILYGKYYRANSRFAKKAQELEYRADASGTISPYDDLFKEAEAETGLDWRLLAAVAYTESRFDPKAESRWGAKGLMQVLPSTAKSIGFRSLDSPRAQVMAGAKYLARLVSRFDESIAERQRIRFALAAYNAGLGHVYDARRLAEQTKKNPDRWFKNVEEALKLKMDKKWHEKTRHGYCRAVETVQYVSSIQTRYDVYVRHVKHATRDK